MHDKLVIIKAMLHISKQTIQRHNYFEDIKISENAHFNERMVTAGVRVENKFWYMDKIRL